MSPSEIAFLALGIVLGAAIGAAIVEAVRSRPAPRREVRVTISPNSVLPRRSTTLAAAAAVGAAGRMPRSPDDDAWFEGPAATYLSTSAGPRRPSGMAILDRTRVLSGRPVVPSSAVAIPVDRHGTGPAAPGHPAAADAGSPAQRPPQAAPGPDVRPGPWPDQGAPSASLAAAAAAIAVLEPAIAVPDADRLERAKTDSRTLVGPLDEPFVDPLRTSPAATRVDIGAPVPDAAVKPRAPVDRSPIVIAPAAIAFAIVAEGALSDGDPTTGGGSDGPGAAAAGSQPVADPCGATRVRMEERCSVASTAADQARQASEALRDAQRAYDTLRERVERAQADADPRALAAGKDELHKQFRAATRRARGAEDTEAAAREWLTMINELNVRVRDAQRLAEAGAAELRGALPRLERMGVEADAARISAENAEAACHEAREQLAACEEAEVNARSATPAGAVYAPESDPDDAPLAAATGELRDDSFDRQVPATQAAIAGMSVIVKVLRGDRAARDRLVASIAAGEPDGERLWQSRIAQLVSAITARAIEDGYLDMPDADTFWSLFTAAESREIVAALSALGYRYDGVGGFADERVPAQRDLSLAVGYAGLDRMRIRNWPRERELAELYEQATVASDEWLVEHAGDLTLGEMVDALGPRAGDLAEVWNNWGRVRPALLEPD